MTTTRKNGLFQPKALALAVAVSISAPAFAVTFNIGEIEGQMDSAMSIGASWSTAKPDKDLIGNGNGGTGYTQTGDDYRTNFKRGETFSKIFKGSHDLELKYRDTGVFIRGNYWYDFELKDEHRLQKDISDSNRKTAAQSSGAQILDAFLYHNYNLADLPGSVRVGRQVVSWGESTFIGNSINSINPLDAAAFRRPGAEIKEGLIPVNMLYVSQGITDRLSMEAFYQLEWDQTIVDNCGTFFATSDVLQDGCANNYHFGTRAAIDGLLAAKAGPAGALLTGATIDKEGILLPRGADRDARDSGQFGLALRWMGDAAEYGAYFMNYHSRTPNVSYQTADAAAISRALASIGATGGTSLLSPILIGNGNYYLEYPEDIRLYGLSFSTSLPTGTAWQGEISYRPNAPVQINGTDLTGRVASEVIGAGFSPAAANQDIRGYNRKEITQIQTTFTHFFDQVMGAERVTVVGEIGAMRIGGLERQSEVSYGRDSIYGSPNNVGTGVNLDAERDYGHNGFATSTSWGYRARAMWDYSNVFAGINLVPSITFSHDVDGYGPVFNEGSKAISIGLDANYRNTYSASLSYTDFFGGDYNVLEDRDFIALSFGVNF